MKKLLTLAACAALLSGCDFVGGTTDSVSFSNLTLLSAPLTPEADGTTPDLYVEIQDAGGRAIVKADRILENAQESDFPVVLAPGGELLGNTRGFFVVVMDREGDGFRLIGASRGFSPDELRASTAPVFEIANPSGTIRAEITLDR